LLICHPVYACDPDGKFILIKKALCNLFHSTRDTLIGKTRYDFLPRDQAQPIAEMKLKVLENKRTLIFESL
jgi:PAS domain-containing protein